MLLDIFPFNNICDWIEFTGNKSVENNEIIKFFPSYKKAIRADSSTYKYLGYYNSLFYYILETDTISHIFTIIGIKNYGEIYSTPVFTTTVTNPIKSYSVDWQLLPDGYIYGGVMNASYN